MGVEARTTIALLGVFAFGLSGCAGADKSEALVALEDISAGLTGGNDSLVCARMHADAQEALARVAATDSCVDAVASGALDQDLVAAASRVDEVMLERSGSVWHLAGDGGEALARLLGVDDLWISEFQGDWMLHTVPEGPSGVQEDDGGGV